MRHYTVTASALNIRSAPSTKKPPIGTVRRGGTWIGTGQVSGDWVAGKTPGGPAGWVHEDFIRVMAAVAIPQEVRGALKSLGWRTDSAANVAQALKDFQAMYNLSGAPLAVTGQVGPADMAALREAVRRGRISAHFAAKEFRCKCDGRHASCRRIRVPRATVVAAEKLRTLLGSFTPVSTYRCPGHNKAVGGFERSQHLFGLAMDIPPQFTPKKLATLGVFSGLGVQAATGKVRHVDLRHLSPDNHPHATLAEPRIYKYG